MKPKGEIDRICDEVGLKVWPAARWQPRTLRTTKARRSLWQIRNRYGAGHLRHVLIAICQTTDNTDMRVIPAPVLNAVSDVLLAHPEWGNQLVEAMDKIKLSDLYQEACDLRMGKPRDNLRVLLAREVKEVLEP
ncbi:MAG: hypothetical protein N4A65_00430 [Cohaesibacter sp.]|jgi:hypothetical protein|nr:hypothetical protein [Cohaesibacter sp.]